MKFIGKITAIVTLSALSSVAFADVVSDVGSVPDYEARKQDKDWSGMLGLAALSAPEYWGSEDDEGTAAPVIIVDYKDTAYFRVNRGGFWFWKPNDNLRVGALIKLRPAAWEEDDDSIEDLGPLPAGFDEPDPQAEAGVNLLYRADRVSFEVQLLSGEDTNVAANLDYRVLQSEQTTLTVRLGVETLGEDTVNYNWYGDISGADADSATNTSLALIGTYLINPEWTLFYGATTTALDDEIDDSIIVEEDTYTVAFIGAGWNF
jgi:outer membrane scaffolding protein for murein synthesis (MipA/OmpV family)